MATIRNGSLYRINGKNYRAYVYTYSHTLDSDGVMCVNCKAHKSVLGTECRDAEVRLERERE